ncbi:unnamed protein product [Oikopleura dioica]|uniref:Sulfotransferase n=1 Tax=Oikopleura dioica TaxID=34765 RepID=E4YP59_OIKDI|nr:unnamed protein product [Oikopleura dioica]
MIKQKRFFLIIVCSILNISFWILFIKRSDSTLPILVELKRELQPSQTEKKYLDLKTEDLELNSEQLNGRFSFQPSEELLNIARKTLRREELSKEENERFNEIMDSAKMRNELRTAIKLLEDERRNSMFEKKAASNLDPIKKMLMEQLPTVFVTGAKKCGTKALIRFFGHHPQVVHGFMESPYHDTGNAIFDVKSYLNHAWLMWKQKNDVVDNISKIKQLIEKEQKINFLGKTANSGIKKIVNFVQER